MTQRNESAASLILNGMSNSDITLMSPKEPHFSKQNMSEAIVQLAPFLSPTPSYQDKKSFDYTKYSIVEKGATPDETKEILFKFMEEIVMNGVISSFEMILLVVECVKRSGDGLKKALFRLDAKTQSSPGKCIFIKWLSYAISRIEERQKGGDILVAGESRVEEMIAANIIELICSFSVIKKNKQLDVLKNKFGVDWVSIVQQTSVFAAAYKIVPLLDSCKKAQNHLNNVKEGKALPYKPGTMPKIVISSSVPANPAPLLAKIPARNPVVVQQQRQKAPVQASVVDLTQDPASPVKAPKTNARTTSNSIAGNSSSNYKSTHINSAQETQFRKEQSTSTNSTAKFNNGRWIDGIFCGSSSSYFSSGGWGNYDKEGMNSSKEGMHSSKEVGNSRKEVVNSSNEVASKPTAGENSGGRENYNKEGMSSSKEVVSKPNSDFSTGGWESYNETSTPRIASNDTGSTYSNPSRDIPARTLASHKPLIDDVRYGGLSANKVDLCAPSSQGIDGLSDLHGYSSWKRAGHEPDPSLSGRDSRENQRSGDSHRQFERKRSNRDSDNDNDNQFKRSRTADTGDSDNYKGSLGRGRDRTTPAWVTNGSQPSGIAKAVNVDNSRRETMDRSSQPSSSGGMNGFNSSSQKNERSSLGRGRDRTTPAWVTNGSQPGGTAIVNSDRERRDNVERSSQPIVSDSMNGFTSSSQGTRGRGRGRGRNINQPAWMTNKSADVTTASTNGGIAASQVTTSQSAPHTPNFAAPRDHERPSYQHQNVSSGRGSGSGRGQNSPAWVAKEDQSGASNARQYDRRLQSSNTGMAGDGSGNESSFGRGRGRTTPAWKTTQNSAGPVTSTERNGADASNTFPHQTYSAPQGQERGLPGGVNGRGRGRGKDQTLPAWMTKSA